MYEREASLFDKKRFLCMILILFRDTINRFNGALAKWKRRGLQNLYARVRFPHAPHYSLSIRGFVSYNYKTSEVYSSL